MLTIPRMKTRATLLRRTKISISLLSLLLPLLSRLLLSYLFHLDPHLISQKGLNPTKVVHAVLLETRVRVKTKVRMRTRVKGKTRRTSSWLVRAWEVSMRER